MPPFRGTAGRGNSAENLRTAISGGNSTDRQRALQELIYLFTKRPQTANELAVSDKSFHRLLEALFQCALAEKHAFYSAKKPLKTNAAKLALTADALKQVVAHGAPNLRRKVARAVVDHITQTLPGPSGDGYVEPLLDDYLKALVALLRHPANVEQLCLSDGEGWLICADFLVDVIGRSLEGLDGDAGTGTWSRASPAAGASAGPSLSHVYSGGRSGTPSTQRSMSQIPSATLVHITQGLLALVATPNAPVQRRAAEISKSILQMLRARQLTVPSLHQAAFAALGSIVSHIQGDNLALVRSIIEDVMPVIPRCWQPRTSGSHGDALFSTRDEILRLLYGLQLHIEALAQDGTDNGILGHIEEVLSALWMEYSMREDRLRLQLGDVAFSFISTSYFDNGIFGLRPYDVSSERGWAGVELMACLEAIHSRSSKQATHPPAAEDDQPRKKRRIDQDPDRLRERLRSPDVATQLAALQVLSFLVQKSPPSQSDLSIILVDLLGLIANKHSTVASWAMVACASCTTQEHAKDRGVASLWNQIWQMTIRIVSIAGTCRAACALLHAVLEAELIDYHEIAEDINGIVTAADIRGPAVLVDSSLLLMHHLLHLRNTMLPSASQGTSNHIMRWAFSRWKPADPSTPSVSSTPVSPVDLVNLLRSCFGVPVMKLAGHIQPFGGLTAQSWASHEETIEMMRYLLLLPEARPSQQPRCTCVHSRGQDASSPSADAASSSLLKKVVLEMLHPILEEFLRMSESWGRRGGEGSSQISADRMQSLASFCVTAAVLAPHLGAMNSSISRDIESTLFELTDKILKYLLDSEDQDLLEICISTMAPYVPRIDTTEVEQLQKDNPTLLRLLAKLSDVVQERHLRQSSGRNPDGMDVDDEFESQTSQANGGAKASSFPRHDVSLALSSEAFYLSVTQRLHLLSLLGRDHDQIGRLPETFLDQLIALPPEGFLLCRDLMREVFSSDLVIIPDDAQRVVETAGGIIGDAEYTCCEVAFGTCLDIMERFLPIWSDDKLEIATKVGDIYSFLVKKSLPNNFLSPKAQIWLSKLLYHLLEVHPSLGGKLELPSCRSTLFSILQDGDMPVKYYIGTNLSKVFSLYVLKVHDDIFVDILESLPSDPDSVEGIAFRLLALAGMACRWPTLLRRCIYHIFETPGRLSNCAKFASRCLTLVSRALGLNSPKELFDLFMPQLLYTWLEHDSIEDIPFDIFGFEDLEELLKHAQTEAAALLIMRGQESEALGISEKLRLKHSDMIRENFSKIMAYSLAHDITGSKDKHQLTGESRIKKILEKESFVGCIYANFADIVAILFDLIDQETPIETYFAKDPTLQHAADAMKEIKKFGHSPVLLPPNQQPMFKAKYLTSELATLCSRTRFEMSRLWTPALVVSVARKLLNTIHPALGPLHACSVLRKLRVLISLAGEQATDSYPLEMLLHSIRPFIQDAECADDALGLTQYLISRGKAHLSQSPSFFAGYALSTLASLRMFLESSQASTTQESQFKATKTKAQFFHNWFSQHLHDYESRAFKHEAQRISFKSITYSAVQIRTSGNAEKGTPESTLLLEILKDGDQDDRLLNDSARDLALGMLCGDFKVPQLSRDDIIETDQDAVDHDGVIWKSCGAHSLNKNYLVWAGRVVGRSFAASGEVDAELLRESRLIQSRDTAPDEINPEHGLLMLLETLTVSRDSVTAGLAESALRKIVSSAIAEKDNDLLVACQTALTEALLVSSDWDDYSTPPSDDFETNDDVNDDVFEAGHIDLPSWAQDVTVYLAHRISEDVVLNVLPPILRKVKGFAEKAFPFVVHLVLLSQWDKQQTIKRGLSAAIKKWLGAATSAAQDNVKLVVNAILYLRTQPWPKETTIADRSRWLDVDLSLAAAAASRCGMFKIALLFAEMASSEAPRASRRSSAARDIEANDPSELLLTIFENIDDPDAYYGLPQHSSLASVVARLEHEKDGIKTLAFRGAQYDSHLRRQDQASSRDGQSLVQALSNLGLAGLSHSLLQNQEGQDPTPEALDNTFNTARRLGIWNLPPSSSQESHAVTVYKAYQSIHQAADLTAVQQAVYDGLGDTMRYLTTHSLNASNLRRHLGALAALTELDDVMNVADVAELESILSKFEERSKWMLSGRYDDVSQILSCRETTLSTTNLQGNLRGSTKISPADARLVEIRGMLLSSSIYRFHHATQESLNLSTSLVDLIAPSEALGLNVDAAVKLEVANSLWDHEEMIASIRMLQSIDKESPLKNQMVPVSRSDLLSKTGYQVSVARLESADSIQKKYLEPALKELKGKSEGKEAGQVFHQFAMFCDEQLQNVDGLEDLARLQNLKKGKSDEVNQLKGLVASAKDSQVKAKFNSHLTKAKQWLELDQQELRRVEQSRDEAVRLSLENYLLALTASDEHNNDALRFTALWLERSGEESTNEAVKKHLSKVPTRKFAPLMNQLTSRLQDQQSPFQNLLMNLVYRICTDHPYHGMYHLWAGIRTKANAKDEVAVARQQATSRVVAKLSHASNAMAPIWSAIDKTSRQYHALALERDTNRYKANQKVDTSDSAAARALIQVLAKCPIPPPTLQIELSADKNYTSVPRIAKVEKSMSIASGVSAPKIITAVGTDGKRYKQLVKGGSDDLRQDAIMEQVFAAVSSLLKLHRKTRQRNLGIRTYKVLPLTASSGLIEFVSNTVALHEYLMPAHEKYNSKDYKGSQCRKEISNVQSKAVETRLATYRKVADKFHPVMRYFFMEKFPDPDDWFVKRLAYSRTTAAISMLGHVLGLGDRHGHNILLDEKTGEVVHIDLGVAFEMGRVLPVPELVPFRMTRDIVDGMGITGTEGVFRRCCEFTLDAMREETYSIMTILDVLRFDPLYSWSISPVRLAKLQDARRMDDTERREESVVENRRLVNEPSEADRALEVVRKKLSKTLSVTATVHDLINQATDERNLAVLYSGWAAYA